MRRIVILSPHADDAIWSLGGCIGHWALKCEVLIITIFNGVPDENGMCLLASYPMQKWRYFPSENIRSREDERAASFLGCQLLKLPYIDAAMRCDTTGFHYSDLESLFSVKHAESSDQEEKLYSNLLGILRPTDIVFGPLALGGHVDHRITNNVACRLSQTLALYEEAPYMTELHKADLLSHIQSLDMDLRPRAFPCNLAQWIEAGNLYRSQVRRLFRKKGAFGEMLRDHALSASNQPICRIWCKASANLDTDPSIQRR